MVIQTIHTKQRRKRAALTKNKKSSKKKNKQKKRDIQEIDISLTEFSILANRFGYGLALMPIREREEDEEEETLDKRIVGFVHNESE